jgi:phycocyanin-associated, rod
MLGQVVSGRTGSTLSGSRCFRYEVAGLRQNEQTDQTNYAIRSSGNVFITVPYNRMNEEMQRITRLGGKIVSIQPLNSTYEGSPESTAEGSPE